RQRQQIGVDHPLHFLCAGAIAGADRRQSDAEHRAFDERQARGEDAGDQRPVRFDAFRSSVFAPAQSTFCAIAASTMLRQVSTLPTAAIASSGSRIVWSTASAWLTCSCQTTSTFSPADGSLPSALLLCAAPASTRATRSTNGHSDSGISALPLSRSTRLRPFGFKPSFECAPRGD